MIFHAPLGLLAALFLVTIAMAAPESSLSPHVYGAGAEQSDSVAISGLTR